MINYDYPLFRPPSEANNLIIQVTLGCSYNNCSFCTMYKSKKFHERGLDEVFCDIDTLALANPSAHKIFLADGDALNLDTKSLLLILQKLQSSFPNLTRVSTYASAQNIFKKSDEELKLLQQNGLNLIYYGIETGNNKLLKKITKGVSKQEIIDSLNRVPHSMKISATVILGIGGTRYTKEHVEDTADVINSTKINFLSTLQLTLQEDAKENFYKHFKDFEPLSDYQIIQEQKSFLEHLNPKNRVIFRSNHASNALHLAGIIPEDKQRLICELSEALREGESAFVPSMFRGL